MLGESSELPSSSIPPEVVEEIPPTQKRSLLGRLVQGLHRAIDPTIRQVKTGQVQRVLSPFSTRPLPTEESPPKAEEPSKL